MTIQQCADGTVTESVHCVKVCQESFDNFCAGSDVLAKKVNIIAQRDIGLQWTWLLLCLLRTACSMS